ncbi:MAG TPA: Do family serine endopeptidase [Novosphingobium sp.]
MRYRHGFTASLLAVATCATLIDNPVEAQAAPNDVGALQTISPRAGAARSFAEMTERLAPAVVNISTRQRLQLPSMNPFAGTPFEDFFGLPQQPGARDAQSLGSGFIISADGYIVTNNHVITAEGHGRVESITVTMPNGEEYPAKLVGRDAASDLAVLKISAAKSLPFVSFGDSRNVRVGDWVVAIGNPFGLGGTVTAGIISAVYRNTGTGRAYDRYLQTDASINRGNSGGPMFDMNGQVIGINNAIFSPTGGSVGIGFAIPSEIAAPIVDKLKTGSAIERGYLGVTIQPITEDLADSLGIPHNRGEFVQAVEPGGAAANAGIRAGDVLVRVDGKDVTRNQTLSYLIAGIGPGRRIPIELIRDGRRITVTATIQERPAEELLARSFDREQRGFDSVDPRAPGKDASLSERALGISVEPVTPRIARQLGAPDNTKGLVIDAVDPSSDAARKGLRRGDILLSANNRDVSTVEQLESAIKEARSASRAAVLLRVKSRGGSPLYIAIRIR